MKKNYFFRLFALIIVFSANCAIAQTTYTKQIIIVNGGDYGNPDDYVTVATYNPGSGETTEFATIYTQSVQDVVIHGSFAFVAAQDSIVKLNIDTYQKVAAVYATGVNQLATNGEVLVASFWYPVTENFVKAFSIDDLSLITEFGGISDEASGIMIKEGIALVAIPGAYGSTTGKIASIDLEQNVVLSEDDYGESFAGIGYFAFYNDITTAFMKTAWGESDSRSATMDLEGNVIEEFIYEDAVLANRTGQAHNNFYAEINNGIGLFNLETNDLVNPSVVAPQQMTIGASVIDTINNLIYLSTTDFYSMGQGFIYNLDGENTGSFEAGISAQAIAVDYRNNTGINKNRIVEKLNVFPNPASSLISFNISNDKEVLNTVISDISGKVVYRSTVYNQIDVSTLKTGIYFVTINTETSLFTGRFLKN